MIIRYIMLTVGALIGAVQVLLFMAPFEIAPGGISGIAVILNHLIDTPIGLMIIILNIPVQVIGHRMLPGGIRTVIDTVVVLAIYSVGIDVLGPYLPREGLSDNILLNALFGGVTGGLSGGLVYRAGATFGGTSTVARIMQYRTGTPMSTTFLYTDVVIIGGAGFVFGWEAALYALVALIVGGLVTDYVLEGPSVVRTAVIITNRPREVSDVIIKNLHRGATSWPVTGMYTEKSHHIVYVTVSRSQVSALRSEVQRADPTAFIVIGEAHAAYGEGFKETIFKTDD